MNWPYCMFFILIYLFSSDFILLSEACWGTTAPKYGDTTRDYDLLVGSVLELNCTLKAESLPGISGKVDSSNIVFKKDNYIFTNYTHLIDARTAQLIIPNAQVSDSGIYHCALSLPGTLSKPHVCSTQVSVGNTPKNVSNFKCISQNFDNLTCTWDIEANRVKTNYSLQKNLFSFGAFQDCPTFNNTFCQWRDDTDPPYQTSNRNLTFIVHGNNSLGVSENEFMLDHFEIVIPNNPENITVVEVGKHYLSIQWLPPKMKHIVEKPPLFYQLWIEELGSDPRDRIVFDVGEELSYRFDGLLPHFLYNISLRCRSLFAFDKGMWSPIISLMLKTEADVPSILPEVHSQAFELYNFEDYRNATLYWKPVPNRYFNGEDFHYHIKYYPATAIENKNVHVIKSFFPVVTIGHLNNDSAYIFEIYSANKQGISHHNKTLYIAERNRIVQTPKEIRAISHELGYYNLSWAITGKLSDYRYTVFWCSSVKPSKSRCDGSIQWSDDNLRENSFILNVTDVHINFQFAVAATLSNESSGMEWASCIVPRMAPLGKIPIRHIEQKGSSSLKIIWSLDCEAQKSVIDRYEITYCKLGRKTNCKVGRAEPNDESYTLQDLHPFSNYSIKLRAFNKENISSEDIVESYQSTLPGAPSNPPQSVKVLSKSGSSFRINWLPPSEPNGIITHFNIYYNEAKQKIPAESSKKIYSYNVERLSYFTKYNITVEACVGVYCSPKSQILQVLTDVGEPGYMDRPLFEMTNSTHLKISWTLPIVSNGPIDFYLLKMTHKGENATSYKEVHGLSTFVKVDCSKVLDGGMSYLFYIQAVNEKDGVILSGPFSNHTQVTACMSQGRAMIIGLAIGGTLTLAIFMLAFYRLFKWMHDKIHQMKNIAVRLPKELEGPELNPLSNYESFKNGLVQKSHHNKIDRLSYVFEESENKNRHGSGSSQFSNSSDELVFKNGKCTKFGRKPSGDSSGCSSMSSNTTTRIHLSSDSGTESDFPVPASPDSVLMEHNIHNLQKPPLPILIEQEALDLTTETQVKPNHANQMNRYSHLINDNDLKVEHPYSKFGISGMQSTVPWRVNSLAFYSCNLSNSEPSVFESQKSDISLPVTSPYSKVGLAKSSGDILGIASPSKSLGYSKFGVPFHQDCFVINTANLNPTVGMAIVDDSARKKWLNDYGLGIHKNVPIEKSVILDNSEFKVNTRVLDKHNTDIDNLKVDAACTIPQKLASGYVSIGDVRSMIDSSPRSMSAYPTDLDELCDTSLLHVPSDFHLSEIRKDLCVDERNIVTLPNPLNHLINLHNPASSLQNSEMMNLVSDKHVANDYSCNHSNSISNIYYSDESNKIVPQNEFKDILPIDNTLHCNNNNGISKLNDDSERRGLNEVFLIPVVSKNGYVPFSDFSCASDRGVPNVPNTVESNVSLSVFPSDICTEFDQNYITPSNKGDLKLLQENLISKNKQIPIVTQFKGKDTFNGGKRYASNGNNISKLSGPLKYLLKPLPKMESEVCEV